MSLENGGFLNPMETAKRSLEGFKGVAERITGVLGVLGISFAAFKSAEGFTEGLKGSFETGKQLQAQSRITGESISDLVVLRQAYKEAGLDAGLLSTSLVMMQNSLGGVNDEGQPTKEIFKELHLNMQKLKGQNAIAQFDAISKAIGGLADQSSKMAAIRAIFGRSGAQMEALFANPRAIEEARKAMGGMGAVMQQNAATFAQISNAFELLGEQSHKFFAGFGSQIAPMLDSLLTKINGIDLTSLGTQVGKVVKTLYAAFQGGELGKLVGLSLKGGVEIGLGVLTDAHTWKALGDLIKGAFQGLGVVIIDAFKPALNMMDAMVSDAVATLSGGKIDPQRDAAKAQYDAANADTDRLLKQQERLLNQPVTPARDKKLDETGALLNNALRDMQASQRLALPGQIDIADRYNFQIDQDPLSDVMKSKQASSAEAIAEGAKEFKAAMAGMKEMAPETRKAISDLISKYESKIPNGASEAGGSKGTGHIDPTKLPHESRKEDSLDRFAKVGLFVGGGGPAADYARRTADNTTRMVAGLTRLQELTVQLLNARGKIEELSWGPG